MYPLIVSVVVKLVGTDQTTVHRGVWMFQILAILLTAALTSRRLGAVLGSETVATLHYALIALNPLLHMLATDLLSDVISALLSYGAVVLAFGYVGQSRSARLATWGCRRARRAGLRDPSLRGADRRGGGPGVAGAGDLVS